MSGLLSFLLFAAFFFVMMRFGCGAHAGHGGHQHADGQQDHDVDASNDYTDPVCGMRVDRNHAYAKAFGAKQYHFCSRDCLDKFDAAPDKYARQSARSDAHPGHGA